MVCARSGHGFASGQSVGYSCGCQHVVNITGATGTVQASCEEEVTGVLDELHVVKRIRVWRKAHYFVVQESGPVHLKPCIVTHKLTGQCLWQTCCWHDSSPQATSNTKLHEGKGNNKKKSNRFLNSHDCIVHHLTQANTLPVYYNDISKQPTRMLQCHKFNFYRTFVNLKTVMR